MSARIAFALLACAATASTASASTAVYVGDSISVETNPIVAWVTVASGHGYASSNLGGMAICDFFPGVSSYRQLQNPVPPDLVQLVRANKPQVVVLQFWGNSWQFTPCMRDASGTPLAPGTQAYYDRYAADANRAMELIRDAAAAEGIPMPKVLWVLQGPDRGNPARTRILNDSYAALRTRWPTAGAIDAGREVSLAANYWSPGSRYGWAQWLPCTQYERDTNHCNPAYGGIAQIHRDDDSLHFCLGTTNGQCTTWSPGVYRYGLAIAAGIAAAL